MSIGCFAEEIMNIHLGDVKPNFSYVALDGTFFAFSESRYDERQRRQRYRLSYGATCWAAILDKCGIRGP